MEKFKTIQQLDREYSNLMNMKPSTIKRILDKWDADDDKKNNYQKWD